MFSHTSPLWTLCPNIHRRVGRTRRPGRRKSSRTSRQWRSMNSEAPMTLVAHQRPQEMCRVLAVHRGCMDDIWLYDGMMCTNIHIYIYTPVYSIVCSKRFQWDSMRNLTICSMRIFTICRGVNQQWLDHIWWQNDCYICTWSIYGIIDGIYLMICCADANGCNMIWWYVNGWWWQLYQINGVNTNACQQLMLLMFLTTINE